MEQVIEDKSKNIQEIINHGIANIHKIQTILNEESRTFKGYNIIDENRRLYVNRRKILDSEIPVELKQILIEKSVVKYYENLFTNIIQRDRNRVAAKVVIACHEEINKYLDNYVIHMYKPENYKKLVEKIRGIESSDMIMNMPRGLSKNDLFLKALIVITLGKIKVIRDCLSVARESLFRDFDGKGVYVSTIAGKLATRLMASCKNIKVDEKPENWSFITLYNNFTVEEAVENIFNIHESVFVSFAIEIIGVLKIRDLFDIKAEFVKGKRASVIQLNNKGFKMMALANANPMDLPIICSPRAIKSDGVYKPYITEIANAYKSRRFYAVRTKIDLLYPSENTQVISDTVNILNKQRFVINVDILEFLLHEWEYGGEDNIFKGYNKVYRGPTETKKDKIAQRAHNSVYNQNLLTLKIAWLYRDQVFYLPVYSDFRGRVYVISNYLSYQIGDLARCLIGFYNDRDPLKMRSFEEIFHHAGNLRGNDKIARNDRCHIGQIAIINVSELIDKKDIASVRKMLNGYPEPFQFITTVFTCRTFSKNNKNNIPTFSSQPILFDASCNGTQHLAALVNDIKLGEHVNLIVANNTRGDFYEVNMKEVSEELAKWQPKTEGQKKVDVEKLKNIKVDRALVKKPVITINYNISLEGIKDQMVDEFPVEWLDKKARYFVPAHYAIDGKEFYLRFSEIIALRVVVYNTLRAQPSIKAITEYLNKIATIMLRANNKIS